MAGLIIFMLSLIIKPVKAQQDVFMIQYLTNTLQMFLHWPTLTMSFDSLFCTHVLSRCVCVCCGAWMFVHTSISTTILYVSKCEGTIEASRSFIVCVCVWVGVYWKAGTGQRGVCEEWGREDVCLLVNCNGTTRLLKITVIRGLLPQHR